MSDIMRNVQLTLYEFLTAADKIEGIQYSDFMPDDGCNKRYAIRRLEEFGWLSKCQKWTQTLCKKSIVSIDGNECWTRGTVSHSILQVPIFSLPYFRMS